MRKSKTVLGDICKITMGQSPDSSTYNTTNIGLPFYQGNADFGELYPKTRIWCSEPQKIAEPENILLSVRAPIGALNIAKEKCCIGRGLAAITPHKNFCFNKYLFYILKYKYNELNARGTGSTFKAINKSILNNLPIDIYSIDRQKRIAAILDKASELIALRKQQTKKLDLLVKSRFIEMFGECKTNPKNWKLLNMEEVAAVGSSKRVFVEELQEEGIPFYRGTEVGALAEGKSITPELYITEEHYKELVKTTGIPQPGDLLMPSICPDGRIWVVNTENPFYFKDGRVLWIHNINNKFNSIFLLYTLKNRIMTDYLSIASGTTFAELKIFTLKKCKIFSVPLPLQEEFAAFVQQIDKTKSTLQQSLEKLELNYKALMQTYFG